MSSEMREEVVSLRRLAEVIRKYGTCAPSALETVANNIERLLARTEAGADGYDDGSGRVRDWRESDTHPQDASGDAEMLDWLETMANQRGGLLLHDGSETGRTGLGLRPGCVNRTLREAIANAMQAKEAK